MTQYCHTALIQLVMVDSASCLVVSCVSQDVLHWDTASIAVFQYPPSILQESKCVCKVLDFGTFEGFHKYVGNLIFSRARNKFEVLVLHHPANN